MSKTASPPGRQNGLALVAILAILVVGGTAVLIGSLSITALHNAQQEATSAALAQAKDGLIGYAISSENAGGATARPGNFPCPDTDAPGTSGYGTEQASCAAGAIGRLPWKTLGLPELRDGSGEPLWYALSGNFRKSAARINSDTRGTLLVYDHDGSTLLTPSGNEAVAIILAPGNITGSQQRNSSTDKVTASNYLDAAKGQNNATTGGPFIAADKSETFNDRLLVIRTRDFIPTVEKRVAKELKSILENYRAANGVYPYPAPFSSCYTNSTCTSDTNTCRGRLPYTALPQDWGGSYSLPQTASGSPWFINNRWFTVIYYSAGTSRLSTAPAGCNATLDVSGSSTPALFFLPGTPLGGVTRTYPNNNLSWYLEDAENQNMDNNYVAPTTNSNDHLHALP
ncbi:MAG TPA: hypothetical protein VFW59_03580 [Gallionella sp.]|nr:hypothetical protein [Gallionella sp.]